jgi:putative transposase
MRSGPPRKNVIIAYERLRQFAGVKDYGSFASSHRKWVDESIGGVENKRDSQWSESIAVGNEQFVRRIKIDMGAMAKGRTIIDSQGGFELREATATYNAILGPENCNIAPKKRCL